MLEEKTNEKEDELKTENDSNVAEPVDPAKEPTDKNEQKTIEPSEPEPEPEPKTDATPESTPEPKEEPSPEVADKPQKGKKSKGDAAKTNEKVPDKKGKGKTKEEETEENPDFKYIVRIANTNVDGYRTIPYGLTGIKGIGIRMATIITDKMDLPRTQKIGDLTDEEVEKLAEIVEQLNTEVPGWMMNRQHDFDSGEDLHVVSANIPLMLRDDVNRLKKIRCYRGIRHEQGQKVRGQRTRANGRTGATVGVQRKKVQQQQSKKK